jgi:poly(3-hydroxybutyrate) depolymerase
VEVVGFQRKTLFSGDRVREYLLRLPTATISATAGSPQSVVFALHCFGCDASSVRAAYPGPHSCRRIRTIRCEQMQYLGPFSEEYGFALVVPEGYQKSFNARSSYCCGDALAERVDDVGFLVDIKNSVRACVRACGPLHGHAS